jgi:hypothetical protein
MTPVETGVEPKLTAYEKNLIVQKTPGIWINSGGCMLKIL